MDIFGGFAGLFLSLGNWLMPETPGELAIKVASRSVSSYRIESQLNFQLTDEATGLVDAGVPLQVKYSCKTGNETRVVYRTLRSDLSNNRYIVSDSSSVRSVQTTKHSNILVAARQFKVIGWSIDTASTRIELVAEILPVTIPRLNRSVDIAPLFGGKRFTRTLVIDRKERQ